MDRDPAMALDVTGGDIFGEAAALRARGPITRVTLPGGIAAWSVTGYDVAREVLADERFAKDARRNWPAYIEGRLDPDFPLLPWARMENMSTMDGESHARQRRLVASMFGRQRIEAMRPRIARVTARALDTLAEVAATGSGAPVDLRVHYAHPVASQVIGELLGVPPSDRHAILHRAGYEQATPQEMAEAMAVIRRNVEAMVAAKRREPGEDLVSDLIAAVPDGDPAPGCPAPGAGSGSDAELALLVLLLLNTGTEPARNLITSVVAALLTRPDQRELVAAGEVSWDDVVEEVLRTDAPVAHMPFRFAVEDLTVAGEEITRGDPVLVNFAATGRDPDLHGARAAEYDAARPDKRHLAFGHGAHRCVGPALARLEARIAVQSLFEQFPGIRLAVEPEQLTGLDTFVMNGRRELPVHL